MPGIPERFARIAKHKFAEFRDRVQQLDLQEAERELERDRQRLSAQGELAESLEKSRAFPNASQGGTSVASATQPPTSSFAGTGTTAPQTVNADPLLLHYRLMGVEPGSDWVTVQGAYNSLSARSDPARFPAGSEDAKQATDIKKRLDESHKILRDALDPTVRRFDMLEI